MDVLPLKSIPSLSVFSDSILNNLSKTYQEQFINCQFFTITNKPIDKEYFEWEEILKPYEGGQIQLSITLGKEIHNVDIHFARLSEEYPMSLGSSGNLYWMLEDLESQGVAKEKIAAIRERDWLFSFETMRFKGNGDVDLAKFVADIFVALTEGIYHE